MVEHLSYSSITSYLACGQAWKYKYVDGIKSPTSPALVFGSAFHGTIEHWVSKPESDLLAVWMTEWQKQLELQTIDWGDTSAEAAANDGLRMLSDPDLVAGLKAAFAKGVAEIETRVELAVPGVPVPVIGYIDVIGKDGVPGDFKTSKTSWNANKAINEMQPIFYLAALNQAGRTVPDGRFRHYVFVKTKKPQFQMIEHVHGPAELFWLFKMIKSVWDGINAGVYPCNPTGWKCAPEYCDYWGMCRGKRH